MAANTIVARSNIRSLLVANNAIKESTAKAGMTDLINLAFMLCFDQNIGYPEKNESVSSNNGSGSGITETTDDTATAFFKGYHSTIELELKGHAGNSGVTRSAGNQTILSNRTWQNFTVSNVGGELNFSGTEESNRYVLKIEDVDTTEDQCKVYFNFDATDKYKITSVSYEAINIGVGESWLYELIYTEGVGLRQEKTENLKIMSDLSELNTLINQVVTDDSATVTNLDLYEE